MWNFRSCNRCRFLLPTQRLEMNPFRGQRVLAEASNLVVLVIFKVALEPLDMAVALEGEHVGGQTVEKHPVVADYDRASPELLQRIFQRR